MSTLYSIWAVNQLADAFENAGFTSDDLTKLRQFKDLAKLKDVVLGKAEISYSTRKWREENGVIYFKLISDGATGAQWIERLEKQGFKLRKYAKELLLSKEFKPTTGVTYEIAVLKGNCFTDENRITKKIRNEAAKRKFSTPNAEIACLIRETFSDKEIEKMGLSWIVTMHKPIKDSYGDLSLFSAYRDGDDSWLNTFYDNPVHQCDQSRGFAFVVSQV